jgi:hypothetical protein
MWREAKPDAGVKIVKVWHRYTVQWKDGWYEITCRSDGTFTRRKL